LFKPQVKPGNFVSEPFAITNIFLTDENVDGPVITIAREMAVISILRDVDLEVPCDIQDYDQGLTDFALANGYVIVTANIRDFHPNMKHYQHIRKLSSSQPITDITIYKSLKLCELLNMRI
jgi:hypothetical protein